MPDDTSHDDCPQREELKNPAVRKAIEDTYAAFFDAIGKRGLKYHELVFCIGQAAARIADTVYANIEASDTGEDPVEAADFCTDIILEATECLEDLLGIEIIVGDDEEVNESFPLNVTTH